MLLSPADLSLVVNRIVAHYDPDQVYVFGSYAKGTMTDTSDLDLLVVRPSSIPFTIRGRNVNHLLRQFAADFDVLFYTSAEIEAEQEDPDGFVTTIIGDAVLLYARGGSLARLRERTAV